jgi:FtsP/CotA-like multicopper oxidase with cupredoxin domain
MDRSSARISRRSVLRAGALAAASTAVGCRRGASATLGGEPRASPPPDLDVTLAAVRSEARLDPSARRPTEIWRFEGQLLRGPPDALAPSPGPTLGPTFRARPGQRVRVRFENRLAESSIVHWHGLDVPAEADGHPRFAVGPGERRVYDFQVGNRAGTYWYHPHPDGRTGPQVYAGLAGLFIVSDGADEARGLPGAPFDLPLVLQDRSLDADGQLVYAPNPMLGMLGDRVFVNGRPLPTFEVRAGSHRLRVLNGSNARTYKLAWSDGSPVVVIGSDGGLLAAPATRPFVLLAPGERVELWADFGRAPAGDDAWLESRPFALGGGPMGGGMMGMGGGMMGGGGPPNGAPLRLCRFTVRGKGVTRPLPRAFEPLGFRPADEVTGAPRELVATTAMMRSVLNGRPFSMTEVAPNERIRLGVTEDWDLVNAGGMMDMSVPHPIHIHGGQFQVVSRSSPARAAAEGLLDAGWKDTFLVLPGERVRVRVRFATHAGLFLYHCHILEHEDMGMMRNFLVEA